MLRFTVCVHLKHFCNISQWGYVYGWLIFCQVGFTAHHIYILLPIHIISNNKCHGLSRWGSLDIFSVPGFTLSFVFSLQKQAATKQKGAQVILFSKTDAGRFVCSCFAFFFKFCRLINLCCEMVAVFSSSERFVRINMNTAVPISIMK